MPLYSHKSDVNLDVNLNDLTPPVVKTSAEDSDYIFMFGADGAYKISKANLFQGLSSGTITNENTTLSFNAVGDINGICYWLGSKNGSWVNPHTSGRLQVSMSGIGGGTVEKIVDRLGSATIYTLNAVNSWIAIDFLNYKIKPNYYSIRHDNETGYYLRNWKLQGSNDATNWIDLDEKNNNTAINSPDRWGGFPLSGIASFYKILRILQTGLNSNSDNYLVIGELEFYGDVVRSHD
jgi:hypothetical protein